MATPTRTQARNHYQRQRLIVSNAVRAVRVLMARNRPLIEVANTVAAYQMASAMASSSTVATMANDRNPLTNARAFAGVSSLGFAVVEPIVATIDRHVPAPVEPVPANWWSGVTGDVMAAFTAELEQLIASEVADAGRTASQVEFASRPDWQNYVRMLNPPSCARCAVLAGRVYRDLDAFDRHPGCDCVMVPVQDWESAHDAGLVSSAQDAFDKGLIRTRVSKDSNEYRPGFSVADERAIRDGADITVIVNATRGTSQPGITNIKPVEIFGRKVNATTYGTTKRALWRKKNPTRMVRLRPEAIYQIVDREYGGDHDQAIRLLRLYGYLTS